jgi:hypothetical protein
MMADMEERALPTLCAAPEAILTLLARKSVRYVTFPDWQRIDKVEVVNGQRAGKPREKLTTISAMLSAIQENS